MNPGSFDALLCGRLSSALCWEAGHKCPCVGLDDAGERRCPICRGKGRYWDPLSDPFQAGITGLNSKSLAALQAKFGDGISGDSTVSLPSNAPCYKSLKPGDRLLAVDAVDEVDWVVSPTHPVALPMRAELLSAVVRQGDLPVEVPAPVPGADGLIRVAVPTVLRMRAPRRYEVVLFVGQDRAFQPGLPRKFLLKLIDVPVR